MTDWLEFSANNKLEQEIFVKSLGGSAKIKLIAGHQGQKLKILRIKILLSCRVVVVSSSTDLVCPHKLEFVLGIQKGDFFVLEGR